MAKFIVMSVLACIVAVSATEKPKMSNTKSCGILPPRMPAPPRVPPSLDDSCDNVKCPKPRNECYEAPKCVMGQCLVPTEKPVGTSCNDGNPRTKNDVCGTGGQCRGVDFTCPATIVLEDSEKIEARWVEPQPRYISDADFTVASSHQSGDYFGVGETKVTYTAEATLPSGNIRVECSFTVIVEDSCRNVKCPPVDECHTSGMCVDGKCIDQPKEDGATCSAKNGVGWQGEGACVAGVCKDLCKGVVCTDLFPEYHLCSGAPVCALDGLKPYCGLGPAIPDGTYARPEPMQLGKFKWSNPDVTCRAGVDLCGPRNSLLPPAMPAPPMVPPSPTEACDWVDCPAAPGQCYYDSVCVEGLCLVPEAKPRGIPCDDGKGNTINDICNGEGKCSGVSFKCPADIVSSDRTNYFGRWVEPEAYYPSYTWTVSGSNNPGDYFPVGEHKVRYEAIGEGPEGTIVTTCHFKITVEDPCADVSCVAQDSCHDEGICVDGFCIDVPVEDGTTCDIKGKREGACVHGFCEDLCAGFHCPGDKEDCRGRPVCKVNAETLEPYCDRGEPRKDGTYSTGKTKNTKDIKMAPMFDPTEVVCVAGENACGKGKSLLPMRPPMPPPLAPKWWKEPEPTTPEPVPQDECKGQTTTLSKVACRCSNTANCYSCNWDNNAAGECTSCKNSKYLLMGSCVVECPKGWNSRGSGNFNKYCEPKGGQPTVTTPKATTPTTAPTTKETTTADVTTKVNPAGDFCVGKSMSISQTDCDCNSGCHTCDFENDKAGQCYVCKNEKYLHNGECVSSCPSGYKESGSGSFYRECVEELTTSTTKKPTTESVSVSSSSSTSSTPKVYGDLCAGRAAVSDGASCTCGKVHDDCHTCDFTDGIIGECVVCKNAQFLYKGQCIDSCPKGTEEAGTGNFNKKCTGEADSDATTNAPSTQSATTPKTYGDLCVGRAAVSDGSSCTCAATDKNCHTCDYSNGQIGECVVCKNAQFRYNGRCVSRCPVGYDENGVGNFNKKCVPNGDAPVTTTTTTTTTEEPPSTSSFKIYDDLCVGTQASSDGSSCTCEDSIDDCHTCDYSGQVVGECVVCKNSMYLYGGRCMSRCPRGMVESGDGKFSRKCVIDKNATPEDSTSTEEPTTTSTADNGPQCVGRLTTPDKEDCKCTGDCFQCSWDGGKAGQCSVCKNGAYLLDGDCIDSCPQGYDGFGSGNYNRVCRRNSEPTTTTATTTETLAVETCIGRALSTDGASCSCSSISSCHTCEWNGGAPKTCVVCKASQYLYQGSCYDSCPSGLTAFGTGTFNRYCGTKSRREIEQRYKAIMSAAVALESKYPNAKTDLDVVETRRTSSSGTSNQWFSQFIIAATATVGCVVLIAMVVAKRMPGMSSSRSREEDVEAAPLFVMESPQKPKFAGDEVFP